MTLPEIEEYEKTVEYVKIGDTEITKENLVAHLSHYEVGDKYEPIQTGSLSDDIGKTLYHHGIVQKLKKATDDFGFHTERIGWKDPDGKARQLYRELTSPVYTFKVRIGGRLKETCETRHEAVGVVAILERRNPDARISMEIEENRE